MANDLSTIAQGGISHENLKLITRAWRLLTVERFDWSAPDQRFRAFSLPQWERIEAICEKRLKPCSHNEAVAAMALLTGSFPFVSVPDLPTYTRQMVKFASRYPYAQLQAAVDKLVETSERLPAPAQLIEAADSEIAELQQAHSRAGRMVKLLKSEMDQALKSGGKIA